MKLKRAAFVGGLGIVWACSSTSGSGGGASSGNGSAAGTSGNGSSSGDSTGSGSGEASGGGGSSGSSVGNPSSGTGGGASGSDTATDSGGASGSSSGSSTSSGSSASSGSSTTPPAEVDGCAIANGKAKFYQVPDDTSATGPWAVGVKTLMIPGMKGGTRPVEVWYPAPIGSDAGKTKESYNLSSWLPGGANGAQAMKIPASANSPQPCDCVRDLPLDTSHGPYPAVIFLHGTGSFRTAELSAMTQWASRGFIAVAADHAGLYLADFLASVGSGCSGMGSGVGYGSQDLNGDVDVMIAGLTKATGDFSFFGTNVDMTRIAIGGHSQGASNAAQCASKPNVEVDFPLADLGGTVPTGSALKSVLLMGGTIDSVVPFSSDTTAYTGATAAKKRLVGITNGNHLDVTDLCIDVNMASPPETGIEVAQKYGVCGAGTLAALAKCGTVSPVSAGPAIVKYATTAALEETLHCANRDAAFSMLTTKYPQVTAANYKQSP